MVFWHQHWNGNEVLGARWVVEIVFAAFRPPPLPPPRIIFVVPPNIAQMKWIRSLKEFDFPVRVLDHPAPVVRSYYRHTLPIAHGLDEFGKIRAGIFLPKHDFGHLTAGGARWVVEIRLVVVLCDRAASAEVNDIVGTVFWCQVTVYLGGVSSQQEKWPRCAFKCLFSADTYAAYGLGLVRVDSQTWRGPVLSACRPVGVR